MINISENSLKIAVLALFLCTVSCSSALLPTDTEPKGDMGESNRLKKRVQAFHSAWATGEAEVVLGMLAPNLRECDWAQKMALEPFVPAGRWSIGRIQEFSAGMPPEISLDAQGYVLPLGFECNGGGLKVDDAYQVEILCNEPECEPSGYIGLETWVLDSDEYYFYLFEG